MGPKVSIIVATFNREQFILESIKSIQNQTYINWECLIIDDGGTDNTFKVLKPILERDKRFKFYRRTEKYIKGLPGCRNYGLDLAKGDFIVFFDDDDIAHPLNLELCVNELSNKEISFCRYEREVFIGKFNYKFDENIEFTKFKVDIQNLEEILRNELMFNSCQVMWRKECFKQNRFVETLMYAEEWELYSRILASGFSGVSINKTLFFGRKHKKSNTGEFQNNDMKRVKSNADAIELVILNLRAQNLLNNSIIKYFLQVSLDYTNFNLFNRIIKALNLKWFNEFKWIIFYWHLPLRLYFYRFYKRIIIK